MNHTFLYLSLKKQYLNSPFFLAPNTLSTKQFKFYQNSFKFFTNSIIFSSDVKNIGLIQRSTFNNILNSAIKINTVNKMHSSSYKSLQTLSFGWFDISECIFEKCSNKGWGGAIESNQANFTVTDTIFRYNNAEIGGAAHILRSWECRFERVLVYKNKAEYAAGIHYDAMNEQNTTQFYSMNFTQNVATKWTGAFRIDHGGGKLFDFAMEQNKALVSSGFLDYSWKPTHKILERWYIRNNTCTSRGAAITLFHIRASAEVHNSLFIYNTCEISADSISVENVDGYLLLDDCIFSGSESKEVSAKYNETLILIENCQFDQSHTVVENKWKDFLKSFKTVSINN